MANNLNIKNYTLQKEKSDILVNSAKNQYLPVINANGRNQYNWGLFIDPATNILTNRNSQIYAASLTGDLTLFDGGRTYYIVKQQKELKNAADFDLNRARYDITLNTIVYYYQVLYAKEQLEIARILYKQTESQLNKIRGAVDAGVMHRRELLNMESELARRDVDIVNSSNMLDKNKLLLRQEMGILDNQEITVEERDTLIVPDSLAGVPYEELVKDVSEKLPHIKAYNSRVKASEHALRSSSAARFPSIGLTSGVVTRSSSLLQVEQHTQFRQNLSEYVGFNINVPLFSRFEVRNKIALSRIDIRVMENQMNASKLEAEKLIQSAYLDMKSAHKKYAALEKQEEALKQDLIFAERSFQTGTVTFVDYAVVSNNYNDVQHQLIQAKYDFFLKKRLLNFYEQGK
jgi:outer membrane protein